MKAIPLKVRRFFSFIGAALTFATRPPRTTGRENLRSPQTTLTRVHIQKKFVFIRVNSRLNGFGGGSATLRLRGALLVAALSICVQTLGQSATPLAGLIAEAERNNPELAASAQGSKAAAHVPRQVSALPDTQLMVQQFSVGSPKPFAGFSNSDFAYIGVGVAQEFPYPGKRGLRAQIAGHEAGSLLAQTDLARTQVVAKLKTAYYELAYSRRSLDILESNDRALGEIEQVAETRYRVGQGNQQEVLKAQFQHTKILQQVTALRGSVDRMQAVLKQLLGRPQESADIVPEPLAFRRPAYSAADLRARAREWNPALRAAAETVKKTETQSSLARREFRPDFNVQYMYQHTGDSFRDYYMATLGVALPNRRRRNAEFAEAMDRQSQAEKQSEAEAQRVLAEVQDQYTVAETAAGQLKIYQEGLLPQSEAVFNAAMAAYQSNRQDFQTLFSAFLERMELELQYQRELLDHETALARLEALTGVDFQ